MINLVDKLKFDLPHNLSFVNTESACTPEGHFLDRNVWRNHYVNITVLVNLCFITIIPFNILSILFMDFIDKLLL